MIELIFGTGNGREEIYNGQQLKKAKYCRIKIRQYFDIKKGSNVHKLIFG